MTTRTATAPVLATPIVTRGALQASAVILGAVLLTALAAQIRIPLPFTPVPITGQTFAVLVVGAGLGWRMGGGALMLYVALGAVGLPFYAGGAAGPEVLFGVTGGYLVALPIAAAVVGWLAQKRWDRSLRTTVISFLVGSLIIYGLGMPWLKVATGMDWSSAIAAGVIPFLVGDVVKAVLAGVALPVAWHLTNRYQDRKQGEEET